ncbi:hypothetical protein GCK72_002957 [Caenorhabditis remanei]|uniref:T-box domain-containing protein n=1 Tax=Caenorhabditis remanei TaxID=31234 RepID=A0A6A5HY80_CAERE|nr:hypothetical protein GCK72_002957 [Caenorhabditis remanei]KAF1771132.1 hypothetical protein GCK72_002957 [Caenorhabditis remanei]
MTTTATSTVSGISVSLSNQEQWEKFYPHTEMVVTRKSGRLLFPHLKYILKGLDEETEYSVFVHFERIDDWKYKFLSRGWDKWTEGDKKLPIDMKQHKDEWKCGRDWMKDPASFDYIKITNNPNLGDENSVLLQSMHIYLPVISIQKKGGTEKEEFRLGITEFMAVTTYQNNAIASLKVELNQRASGFRQTGGHNNKKRGIKRPAEAPPLSSPPLAARPVTLLTVPPTVPRTVPRTVQLQYPSVRPVPQWIQPLPPIESITLSRPENEENQMKQPVYPLVPSNMVSLNYPQFMDLNSINNVVSWEMNNGMEQMPGDLNSVSTGMRQWKNEVEYVMIPHYWFN